MFCNLAYDPVTLLAIAEFVHWAWHQNIFFSDLDDDTIDAQSFLFLIAGYETSSTLLSYGIHTLAVRPDLQDKLREHIQEVTKEKEITYELLTELTYLEGFILGKYQIYWARQLRFFFVFRKCVILNDKSLKETCYLVLIMEPC